MRITYDETQYEINDAMSLWPFWSYKKRRRSLARLRFKLDTIQRSIEEKTREVQYHLTVIDRKYSHLKKMTEDEIISSEGSYWAMRLGRQLGASHMSRIMGVSESELLAVLALPKEQQQQIFSGMRMLLTDVNKMLPSQQKREDQSDDK
jgi:hypothetical protein